MYKLTQDRTNVIRLADNAYIPFAAGNKDYQEYLQWVENGGVPEEELPPVIIPTISARQIRLALNQLGLRAQVEAAVSAGDQDLKDSWEYATEFQRNHPLVIAMQAGLNLTDTIVDGLFTTAASIV